MNSNRIKELQDNIIKARIAYYNKQSIVSDKIFDTWIDELNKLDPKNSALIEIGSEPISNWEKYTHLSPMGSLNKCQTYDEFIKWKNDYIADTDQYFLTLKLDGLSVSLIYEDGVLSKAVTRGSGITGELITANVIKMLGVPLRLKEKINATIRGEILLSKENYSKFFKDYSNTRNAASGISRRYDGQGCDKLSVLVYQLLSDDVEITTYQDQFIILTKLGFMVPNFQIVNSAEEILTIKNSYQASLRDKYEFELDGLVIHNNDLNKCLAFGDLHGRPKASIAFKFDSIAKEAKIIDIINQVGSSGRITPVAVFSPKVNLMGADIERASLHNFTNINELGIDIGCTVLVCRSNDVIPYIEELVTSTNSIFKSPKQCPACQAETIETGEYLQCPNFEQCPAQIKGRILNWISVLDIKEWGEELISRLVDNKKIFNINDLYSLSVETLAGLDRMGDKSAKKCYDILREHTNLSLDEFLGGLSIPMVGPNTIKMLMTHGYESLEDILKLSIEDFEKVPGLGPIKAKSLKNGLLYNKDLINNLLENGIAIKQKIIGKLTGKSICITGSTVNKRSVLEKMIVDAGGTMKSSVGKNLNYLIIADINSASSKAVAARKLGTTLLSENDFLNLLKSTN